MPFVIKKNDAGQWCCYTQGEDGDAKGDTHGCHASREEAVAQLRALYANVPEARKADLISNKGVEGVILSARKADDDFAIYFGPAVKALGNGKIRALLAPFTDASDPDADEEFFDARTDFARKAFPAEMELIYHHGMDDEIGDRRLGYVEVKSGDAGLWFEHQLDLSDRYEAKMYRLAEMGRLGASSGAVLHRVRKSRAGKAVHIDRWPINEASLTVTPAHPAARVMAAKSWTPIPIDDALKAGGDVKSPSLAEVTERWIESGETLLGDYRTHAMKAGRKLSAARRERLAQMHQLLGEMLAETDPDPTAASRDGEQPTEEAGASSDAGDLEAQFMAINARLNGVPVPLGASHANPGGTTQ